MTDAAKLGAFHQRHPEFFLQFARECNFRRFAVPDFSAGKFPLEGRSVVFSALADQQSPVAALDHSRHYGYHLSAFLCVLSVAELSSSSLFAFAPILRVERVPQFSRSFYQGRRRCI